MLATAAALRLALAMLLLCLAQPLLACAAITFREVVVQSDQWSPREHAAVEWVQRNGSVTFYDGSGQPVTLHNYFLLYGGQDATNGAMNDVWVSATGSRWSWVAGHADGVAHPSNPDTFEPHASVAFCQDSTYRQYRAGGVASGELYSDVWTSTNGVQWSLRTDSAYWSPRYYANMAADSANNVYIAGGVLDVSGTRRSSQEVWRSTAASIGRQWRLLYGDDDEPLLDGPTARGVAALIATGRQQLHWLAGVDTATQEYKADVWAMRPSTATAGPSTELARVTAAAPWGARDDSTAEYGSNGVMVLVAGYNGTTIMNDVWVSADGGYVWSQCVAEAQWSDRRYQMSALGGTGHLWVMGGSNENGQTLNDIWVSTASLYNETDLQSACSLGLPFCGSGLRCWPSDATTTRVSGGYVLCPACSVPFPMSRSAQE